jgi:hypothetical protein
MIHTEKSKFAGKEIKIKDEANQLGGRKILIEDWWDKISGNSWTNNPGNFACSNYLNRIEFSSKIKIPLNDEVLYGKINGLGYLVHINEIE